MAGAQRVQPAGLPPGSDGDRPGGLPQRWWRRRPPVLDDRRRHGHVGRGRDLRPDDRRADDDPGSDDDAPARSRAARRPVHARRGVGRPARRRGHPVDPAGARPAGRWRHRRHARRGRARRLGGGHDEDLTHRRCVRCRHRLGPTTPTRPRRRDRAHAGHGLLVPLQRRAVHQHDRTHGTMPATDGPASLPGHRPRVLPELRRRASTRRTGTSPRQLDALVFLGDYIYEGRAHPSAQDGAVRSHNGAGADRPPRLPRPYALYRTDADLQASHASTAGIVTWDDHEVENNYAGDHGPGWRPIPEADFHARRAAAYQAWWEHQPVRLPPPTRADYQIYRSFGSGRSAALPARRPPVPQRPGLRRPRAVAEPPCPETFAPGRTLLGTSRRRGCSTAWRPRRPPGTSSATRRSCPTSR